MKRLIAFSILCLGILFQATAQDNGLLWKIIPSGGGEASYLFGTYHLVGSDYLQDHEKVNEAYSNSGTVVIETEIDSAQLMSVMMQGMMLNNSLRKLLDSADYQLVKDNLEPEIGISLAQADQFKPTMIATMYSMTLAQKMTPPELKFDGQPIDMYFAKDGKKKDKKVVSLETPLEQAKILFSSQTVEEQAADLVKLAKEVDEVKTMTRIIMQAYLDEDIITMWEQAQKYEEANGDMDELVDNRNIRWVKELMPLLDKGNTFIAVGALHLPGEKGLITLLKEQGYTISPVN